MSFNGRMVKKLWYSHTYPENLISHKKEQANDMHNNLHVISLALCLVENVSENNLLCDSIYISILEMTKL